MSKLTAVTAALLVVLAGYGIAGAATVTLSIQFANTTLTTDGVGDPNTTTYTVYGMVNEGTNTTDDTFGVSLNGGLVSYMTVQEYTGTGTIKHARAAGPPSVFNAATASQAPFTALSAKGTLNPAVNPNPGTAGVNNTQGGSALPSDKFDYYTSKLPYEYGYATPVALYTGSIIALADGTVTVDVSGVAGQILVWQIDVNGLKAVPAETVVAGSQVLTIGSATNPTITINTPDVGADDWTGPGDWANGARSVAIDSTITDATVVEWKLTNPNAGGSTHTLAATTEDFTLTMAEINALFGGEVPAAGGLPGVEYNWILTGTVNPSDSILVFVPEPTTIGLLGFGVVGALLRRRRRA